MAYSIDTLPEAFHEEAIDIVALWDEATESTDDDLAAKLAQQVYDRAARIELPIYMVFARALRIQHEYAGDDYRGMIGTYLEIMRLVDAHADVIDPDTIGVVHQLAAAAFLGLIAMPGVPLAQVTSFLDEAEREQRKIGTSLWSVFVCRTVLAAQIGDREETQRWADEWHIEGPAQGENGSSTISLDATFLAPFDLPAAIAHLEQRVPTASFHPEDEFVERIEITARLAGYRSIDGDTGTAAREIEDLIERVGLDAVIEHADGDDLVRALEASGRIADEAALRIETDLDVDDANQYLTVAALARHRLRRDPASPRGLELRGIAERGAAAFDHRNGSRFLSTQLAQRWFADL